MEQRLWLLFFGDGNGPAWWKPFLRPGFRHVGAAAWFDEAQRWVYIDAASAGVVLELWTADGFNPRLSQLIDDSHVILRVRSAAQRSMPPRSWWCVGMVKALLGVRCRALLPHQLYRHLLRNGAEIVEVPRESREAEDRPADGAGRPVGDAPAQRGAAAGGTGPG